MKVLVTGGTGFTGSALVRRLIEEGHQVVALDYREGIMLDRLRRLGAEIMIGSVTDRDLVRRAMHGVEVVHHLAAAFRELNVPESHYYHVNVDGTRNVVREALEHGARKFVYCSTCGVHGNIDNPPGGEDAPIQPADYYQQTKYLGEEVVHELGDPAGLDYTILRPAAIYGPGDPERFYMIFKWVKKGYFPMFGSGKTFYHPLYIDNLIDAFMLAMEPGAGRGRAYLIADEHFYPIKELVKRVAKAMQLPVKILHFPLPPVILAGHVCEKVCKPLGIVPPIFPRRVDWYRQNRAFKIDRAKAELGYRPRVGIDEGLRNTAIWYRQEGYL